jgi:hypothetical protein
MSAKLKTPDQPVLDTTESEALAQQYHSTNGSLKTEELLAYVASCVSEYSSLLVAARTYKAQLMHIQFQAVQLIMNDQLSADEQFFQEHGVLQ